MAEIVCARCGHPNSAASNYCSSCGFDLRRSVEEKTTEMAAIDLSELAPVAEGATFVVKRGHRAGDRYELNTELTTVGRHPDSDIFLDDVTVSRRHAEVRFADGDFVLADVGSLNGTYLNRTRIDTDRMTSGDEVQIGKFKLVFITESND